jgi:hypothetical protein
MMSPFAKALKSTITSLRRDGQISNELRTIGARQQAAFAGDLRERRALLCRPAAATAPACRARLRPAADFISLNS